MRTIQPIIAILCCLLVLAPAGLAQDEPGQPRLANQTWHSGLTHPYSPAYIPPVVVSNTNRLSQLIMAGNLYLSLRDAVALALENNVNIEVQRYTFDINDWAVTGARGTAYDQTFTGTFNWGANKQIQTNSVTAGGQSVNVTQQQTRNFGVTQNLSTGGNLQLSFNNSRQVANNINTIYIPNYNASLGITGTQPLLRGFGSAFTNRNITIAQNNQQLSNYQFMVQVNTILNNVITAYWNLVNARQNVQVQQQTLELSETLLNNNRRQVEVGTLAPIDAVNAETQVATNRTALIQSQTTVLQNETTLKNLLSRNGVASADLQTVSIIPTDLPVVPDVEPVQPLQDLMTEALANRPEVAQNQITIENNDINIKAQRNTMLPQLNFTGNVSNPGVGGVPNPQQYNTFTQSLEPRDLSKVPPQYIGGYTNILRQMFTVPTLTYQYGLTLSIPLRNRAAKAQMAQLELQQRQAELNLQAQINTIRVAVQNALIAIEQARAQYQSATTAEGLQEQLLEAEQKRYDLDVSTIYTVVQYQRDLANARRAVVTAQVAYANAKLQMDLAKGTLLQAYGITFEEAKEGQVDRPADGIPDVIDNNAANQAELSPLQRAIRAVPPRPDDAKLSPLQKALRAQNPLHKPITPE